MPKKQGKAKGLARAKTRPAGKKAKGRPFQEKAKGIDPTIIGKTIGPKPENFDPGPHSDHGMDPGIGKTQPRPALPDLRPRFTPTRTEKSLLKKSERLAGYASVLAAGMLSNPELIDDLHDQDSIASIIETAMFMATQIEQRV